MANDLVRPDAATVPAELAGPPMSRRLSKALAQMQGSTLVRQAAVRGEAIVAREKVDELAFVTWKAMDAHVMLDAWAHHRAGENPVLLDELRFFKDTARLGMGEIVADVVDKFRRM